VNAKLLYNGLVHKHKSRLILPRITIRSFGFYFSFTSLARPAAVHSTLLLGLLLWLSGCSPSWQAKQADFFVESCTSIESGLVSNPETWKWQVESQPVIARGPAGAWDSSDVLNPSVVAVGGTYYNLYSGYDGRTWHTGLATSSDGVHWDKFAGNPVVSPQSGTWEGNYIAANGSVLYDGTEFLYWYEAGGPFHIGLARSADAKSWRREPQPVFDSGPEGAWDESGVADPFVLRCGTTFYMYYLGQNRNRVQRLGVARSPDGVHWQKFMANPVLGPGPPGAFDERGTGEPAVFRAGSEFYMIYTGRSSAEERRLGAARSRDGVYWRRAALRTPVAGGQPWDRSVVCDAAIWATPGRLWLWFGGGDLARPDQGLNGQIGLATLTFSGR